ncbi:MAG: CGNR zinc finger domain-containing protein [Rhodospirillales bacterium]|nr:CGNR zinc finger domain-containing protein [Rhodospirillales bacterium]
MEPLWLELVNSRFNDYRGVSGPKDRLDDGVWFGEFISNWPLEKGISGNSELLELLRSLRAIIRKIVDSFVTDRSTDTADWEKLNVILSSVPITRTLEISGDNFRLKETPMHVNAQSMLADIVLSFVKVFTEGDPSRLRVCENKDCRWIFYDTTRSRTRRWCEDSTCGNLMKVRRFRKRKKNKGATPV